MRNNGAMPAATETDLEARIRALEEENARLTRTARPRASAGWWRGLLSAVMIVVATILVPTSVVATWTRIEMVSEDAFVATLAPLAHDPAVQAMVVDEITAAIDARVDFAAVTGDVFDGVESLGLPPRAAQALNLLRAPAAQGVQSLVDSAVERVVRSDAFAEVWEFALRSAHRSLTTAATASGGGVLVLTDDGLGISLAPIIEEVKGRLVTAGVGVASFIPAIDKVIIIGDGQALIAARTAYVGADIAGWWLPVLTIALFAGGILVARRRTVAVIGTGVGLIVGGSTLALSFALGSAATALVASQAALDPTALGVIYGQLTSSMAQSSWAVAGLGLLVALLGWLAGSSASGRRTRQAVSDVNAAARAALAHRGLDTGRTGVLLGRYRVVVRAVLIALGAIWLFALRPLTVGDVVLVLAVTLIVAWILELLQKREDPAPAAD